MILLSLVSTALLKVRLPFPIRPSAKPKSCDLGYNYECTNTGWQDILSLWNLEAQKCLLRIEHFVDEDFQNVVRELVARGACMAICNTITKRWGQSSLRGQHYTVYFDKTKWHCGWGLKQDALLQRINQVSCSIYWEDNTNQPCCRVPQEPFNWIKEYKSVDFLSGSSIYSLCLNSFV